MDDRKMLFYLTADSFLYHSAQISYIEACKSDYNINIVKIIYIYVVHCWMI